MREISYILAALGIMVLLASAAAWKQVARRPALAVASARARLKARIADSAATATFIAVGLSGAAAVFAILGWFGRG